MYHYWNQEKEKIKRYYENRRETNWIPTEDKLAERLGYTEIRCSICKNFQGSKNWKRKHYYSYARENYYNPIVCDYKKDTA